MVQRPKYMALRQIAARGLSGLTAAMLLSAGPLHGAAAAEKAGVILPTRKPTPPTTPIAAPPTNPVQNVTVTASSLTARDKEHLARAMQAAAKNNWAQARAAIAPARNPLLHKIVEWAFLRAPGPHTGFITRTSFLAANPKWPSATEIRRRAEDAIDDSVPLATLSAWFAENPPLTTSGKVAYARALRAEGKAEEAHTFARDAWTTGFFTRDNERAFLREFESILTADDHWARVDLILYDEQQTAAAERILSYLDHDKAEVARARIALITSKGNIDAAVNSVSAALKNDSGLIYDRVKWRRQRGDNDGARQLIPDFALEGARPDLWWRERYILARDALNAGNITEAYKLARHHGSLDPLSVSEAEWFAGWIALRFLKDGETALAHFEKVYDAVSTPPSLARGAYWTGRTTESLGRPDLAAEWYQRAATYVTTYYGQLALARLRGDNVPQLPQDPQPTQEERDAFNANELTHALRALIDIDAKPYQRPFAQALAEFADSATYRHMTSEMLNKTGRVDLGVVIARQAARDKITLLQYGYPAPAYAYPSSPEKALILAITRQESNFDTNARSSAGARGLMQLMPATAKGLAKREKLAYAEKKLTEPAYNMRLGSAFLTDLVGSFDGSYILAAAAYNAGPSRARQWVKQFGDPRDSSVDPIDWIEQIPFSETRNYVQRVMENVMIYRAVLAGKHDVGRTLETELVRRQ
jgi:soluble lytic murein transglycosylase